MRTTLKFLQDYANASNRVRCLWVRGRRSEALARQDQRWSMDVIVALISSHTPLSVSSRIPCSFWGDPGGGRDEIVVGQVQRKVMDWPAGQPAPPPAWIVTHHSAGRLLIDEFTESMLSSILPIRSDCVHDTTICTTPTQHQLSRCYAPSERYSFHRVPH